MGGSRSSQKTHREATHRVIKQVSQFFYKKINYSNSKLRRI
ncbi:hypothetical protein LEP1GSC062_0842 [Leptospira alexanderi serovar Manhao 3 str. L 60]|uniref:Uncharacterized protein n=1 Tax=Leptospira alexanderi serovar Manhao 3 str. L 60 TaxID=1049759 RepID=V6I378_9LEPT|nr:hypothetical protein LEP1GSC062_0842 [Leptospira alexanderi serovar Manhao 3 str. L 60]